MTFCSCLVSFSVFFFTFVVERVQYFFLMFCEWFCTRNWQTKQDTHIACSGDGREEPGKESDQPLPLPPHPPCQKTSFKDHLKSNIIYTQPPHSIGLTLLDDTYIKRVLCVAMSLCSHARLNPFLIPFKRFREEKLKQQKKLQEERLQRALERAQATVIKKVSAIIHRNILSP